MKTPTHWTISRLKNYETCPAQYRYSYMFELADWQELGIDVVPSTESPAMARGTRIHEGLEGYLKGAVELSDEVSPVWQEQVKSLRYQYKATSEEQWEFEEGWHPRENGELWLRMKIDAWFIDKNPSVYHVIDFKTGKPYPSNVEQIEVYSLAAFAKFDDAQVVRGALWYLDHEEPQEKTFHREDASKLARKWEQRSRRMLTDVEFQARPGRQCGWCAYKIVCPSAPRK